MAMIANKKTPIIRGLISLDFGNAKFGTITIYTWKSITGGLCFLCSGFGLSILAGVLFSLCFTFMQLMELCSDSEHQNVKGIWGVLWFMGVNCVSSLTAIDYTFGLFTGILLASTFYFAVYAAYKRNKPIVYPKIILPGMVSGIMWGIATSTYSALKITVNVSILHTFSWMDYC